jgi:hypothetical protein
MKWMQCALYGAEELRIMLGWISTWICRLWPSRLTSYNFCMTSAAWHSGRSGSFLSVWAAGKPSIAAIHGGLFPGIENPGLSMARVMAVVLPLTASRLFLFSMLGRPCTPRCLLVLAGSLWVSASIYHWFFDDKAEKVRAYVPGRETSLQWVPQCHYFRPLG